MPPPPGIGTTPRWVGRFRWQIGGRMSPADSLGEASSPAVLGLRSHAHAPCARLRRMRTRRVLLPCLLAASAAGPATLSGGTLDEAAWRVELAAWKADRDQKLRNTDGWPTPVGPSCSTITPRAGRQSSSGRRCLSTSSAAMVDEAGGESAQDPPSPIPSCQQQRASIRAREPALEVDASLGTGSRSPPLKLKLLGPTVGLQVLPSFVVESPSGQRAFDHRMQLLSTSEVRFPSRIRLRRGREENRPAAG